MNHAPLHDVTNFEIVADYTLHLIFDDGTEKTINFEPILWGPVFGPLRDISLFNQVQLDVEAGTVVWSNGADFDPSSLYAWEQNLSFYLAGVEKWQNILI